MQLNLQMQCTVRNLHAKFKVLNELLNSFAKLHNVSISIENLFLLTALNLLGEIMSWFAE